MNTRVFSAAVWLIRAGFLFSVGATMTTLANSIEKTAKPTLDHKEVSGLSNQLRDWLQRHPSVSQSAFAKKVLERSQGTMSNLLRWRTVPISKQGEGVWLKIKHFFENTELQEKLVRSCADQEEKGTNLYTGGSNKSTPIKITFIKKKFRKIK